MHVTELHRILTQGVELSSAQISLLKAASLPSALADYARLLQTAASGAVRLAKVTFGKDVNGTTSYPTIAVTDDGSTGSASQEFLDFPASSVIAIDACYTNLTFTTTAAWAPTTPVVSIGTAAAGANATLTSTEADVVPSTSLTISSGASAMNTTSLARAITALTDSSGGSASSTLAAISGSYTQSEVRNSIASLAAQIELLRSSSGGIPPLIYASGTKKLYLNFACNSDPSTGKTIIPAGSVWVWWRNLTP